jgi:hypothetical protein
MDNNAIELELQLYKHTLFFAVRKKTAVILLNALKKKTRAGRTAARTAATLPTQKEQKRRATAVFNCS